jgi:hypothetical protein
MAACVHPVADAVVSRISKCRHRRVRPVCWAGLCIVFAAAVTSASAEQTSPRFIFISSPSNQKIYYAPLLKFEDASKNFEDRPVQEAQVLIDGSTTTTTVAPVTPAPTSEDDDDTQQASFKCYAEGSTCNFADNGQGCDADCDKSTNIRVYSETTTTKEDCENACAEADDCTGYEIAKDDAKCIFWLNKRCDAVTEGSNALGFTESSSLGTTCTKQDATTTTTTTTTTGTTTTTMAGCEACLVQPEGLAIWHGKTKAVLYVADKGQSKILGYEITGTLLGTVQAGYQQKVLEDIAEISGLAMDGFGNLYFATSDGTVGFLPANKLDPLDSPAATILYASDAQPNVQNPIALAADNFRVYWANSANGQQNGVIVTGFERNPEALKEKYPDFPKALSKNVAKAMGVCIAKSNVFFTAEATSLWATTIAGQGLTEVSKGFEKPVGCAYDGEATLYVADQAGAIYSLPANFPTLRPVRRVQKVATAEAPSYVAVFTGADAYQIQSADKGFLGLGW